MYSLILQSKNDFIIPILTNARAGLEMSGLGRAFDKCSGRAGRPGSLGVAGRGSLISPVVAGHGARVGDLPRPCQPWRGLRAGCSGAGPGPWIGTDDAEAPVRLNGRAAATAAAAAAAAEHFKSAGCECAMMLQRGLFRCRQRVGRRVGFDVRTRPSHHI